MVMIFKSILINEKEVFEMDYQKISPDEVKKRLTAGEQGYLLDVRTPVNMRKNIFPKVCRFLLIF
jgi:hypothetical protein